ncbi:MAG: phosphoglycerate dehydrogenase [Pirellulales bacterium]
MSKVLITTEAVRHRPGPHLAVLTDAGFEYDYPQRNVLLTEDETLAAMQGCAASLAGSEPYTDRVLAGLPELRVISRNGVGYDRIDVAAATRRGVAVTITPEGNHQAVAEHAMALLLAVSRSIVSYAVATREGIWRRSDMHLQLRGKTLGIVGLGRIGRSVAQRAAAFGMRLVACETFPDAQFVARYEVDVMELDQLLATADYVTLHTPMGPDTRELINARTLRLMKPGSVLINTARGGLVNEDALLAALRSGHLAGAGLDVLQAEPPPADHPLLKWPNVVVTPHIASFDTQGVEDMSVGAARNIVDILQGRWPTGCALVNPEVKATWRR